ncbi:MAG: PorT family protein [Chitinophagaceae bacterium]|jgi:hypothetical protein|nr:PorT family protein [Chitinophagaceae bacterium]
MNKNILLLFFLLMALPVWSQVKPDTLVIDGVTVIRDNEPDTVTAPEKKGLFKKLNSRTNPKNFKTEWAIIDLGISNYVDNTNYVGGGAQAYAPGINDEWLTLNPFKSQNVNLWFVMQHVNLLKHVVNLQYGLGLEFNNYRYKQPVRYNPSPGATLNPPILSLDQTPGRSYSKNKLATSYATVPLMLNFSFTPYRLYPFELAGGVSVGYLYASRNKTITSDEGKKKARDDFDLRPWKLSYIGELSLGIVTFYGSYAPKSMYKRGLEIAPYTFGIRFRPASIFSKIETN